ncbi:four helix bundle protein [Parafilimonas terrae]|uniref:Four helix bundle protein n=1 Tax=Parafilimonas terrae TaxID=1465490 RepID=A0A1I5ZA47_9BACT|nr:four helix bundle protein [Parafilimonas terrae]SFQ53314.1 four helix bundle protein [Parafilimonas terrae]
MATIKCFEDIISWQRARELCRLAGELIDDGKFKHSYRLIDQIEGSSGSIMDNIAEGFERSGNREFIQFLYISKGSCGEFRSRLYRALDRKYLNQYEFYLLYKHAKEIIVLLQKLIDYLQTSELKGTKFRSER